MGPCSRNVFGTQITYSDHGPIRPHVPESAKFFVDAYVYVWFGFLPCFKHLHFFLTNPWDQTNSYVDTMIIITLGGAGLSTQQEYSANSHVSSKIHHDIGQRRAPAQPQYSAHLNVNCNKNHYIG